MRSVEFLKVGDERRVIEVLKPGTFTGIGGAWKQHGYDHGTCNDSNRTRHRLLAAQRARGGSRRGCGNER